MSELIIAGDANVTITGGRYSKVTVETGGVLQLRGGAVDSLIIKSEGHVSVMDSIVNSVTREDGAHFLGTADREVTTAQGLAAALADSEVSKVILTADVQLTGSRLDVSRYVPVDLNGHVLRSNGSNIVFWVGNGGYLELNDSDPESTHSDFSVKGGIITGGKVPHGQRLRRRRGGERRRQIYHERRHHHGLLQPLLRRQRRGRRVRV